MYTYSKYMRYMYRVFVLQYRIPPRAAGSARRARPAAAPRPRAAAPGGPRTTDRECRCPLALLPLQAHTVCRPRHHHVIIIDVASAPLYLPQHATGE